MPAIHWKWSKCNGSGNRNKVVGDSIFNSIFYPHFGDVGNVAHSRHLRDREHDILSSRHSDSMILHASASGPFQFQGYSRIAISQLGAPTPIVPYELCSMAPLPEITGFCKTICRLMEFKFQTSHAQKYYWQIRFAQNNKINGLDVISSYTDGQLLNGTVVDGRFNEHR